MTTNFIFPPPMYSTSASAPLTAGIFALINDNILNNGGSPLGFLNPALYQAFASGATIAQDVTYGNNTVRFALFAPLDFY